MSESNFTVVGIDVSKAALDVAARPEGLPRTFSNDESGIQALVGQLKELKPSLIVLEATGGLEMPAVAALAAEGLPVVVVNPRQVRDFVKAIIRRRRYEVQSNHCRCDWLRFPYH